MKRLTSDKKRLTSDMKRLTSDKKQLTVDNANSLSVFEKKIPGIDIYFKKRPSALN